MSELGCSVAFAQWIEPRPSQLELGESVRVEARTAEGRAFAGLSIEVVDAEGVARGIGVTDHEGYVEFAPSEAGAFRLRAECESVELLAPMHVYPRQPRLWIALVSTPLGLWLLWRALRRRRA